MSTGNISFYTFNFWELENKMGLLFFKVLLLFTVDLNDVRAVSFFSQ